jgi:hypothetical protein
MGCTRIQGITITGNGAGYCLELLSLGIRQGINAPLLDSEGEIVRTVKIVSFVFMQTYLAPSLLIHAWPFLVPFIQTLLQQ